MNAQALPKASRLEQLDAILTASLAMLDFARAEAWESLESLEEERRALVADCFREPTPAQEAQQVADYITRILEVNQEITSLAEAGREAAGRNVQLLGAGKAAQKAYRQHAR